jgi:3',5'-nucleoside bisphosphate phosphatase
MMMNRNKLLLLLLLLVCSRLTLTAQVRHVLQVPDIMGYKTLKVDFHMHTVFSDGLVWPTIRVDEAWREGLDAISITDHLEYLPFRKDVAVDHNRSYEVAKPQAERMDVLLVRGSEITRVMPPGHFNVLFLEDANKLDVEDWRDAFHEAKKQDAFFVWLHPGWYRQAPDTTIWKEEHTWIYENGMMHGIEVVNGRDYYPEAHQWALNKGLTMFAATDVHNPIGMDYNFSKGEHRPMTLVFAEERSTEGIRDAIENQRTVAYYQDKLIGEAQYLEAIFLNSLEVHAIDTLRNRLDIRVYNSSGIPFQLTKAKGNDQEFEFFRHLGIPAEGYATIMIFQDDTEKIGGVELKLIVDNLLVAPGKGLPVNLELVPSR